jgi:hypothetical protein
MTKLLMGLAACVTAALAVAGSAAADGPVIVTQQLNATNVPLGPTCGAEPIMQSYTATRRVESFFDGSTLVLQRRHVRLIEGTITLLSTGVSLPQAGDFTFTLDFTAQIGRVTGQQDHVVVPGGGGVLMRNSGLLVEDLSQFPPEFLQEAGQHDFFDPGGLDQVCAALGA